MARRESYHWLSALSTVVCFAGGIGVIGYGSTVPNDAALAIPAGLLLMGISVVAFIITGGWQHANDLPVERKIVAYIPVILGGIFVGAAYIILRMAWQALKESASGR